MKPTLYKILFLFFLLNTYFGGNSYARGIQTQLQYVDTLSQIVESSVHDTIKIDAINDYIFRYASNSPAYFIPYCDIAINKSIFLSDSVRLSRSLNRKAVTYYFMDDYRLALNYYLNALQISERVQIPENIASDYNNIGLVLLELGIYKQALDYFLKSSKLLKESKRNDIIARVYDNIGMAHYSLQNYDSALVWYSKSFEINNAIKQMSTLASNIKNVGNVLIAKGDFKTSAAHFEMSANLYDSLGNFKVLAEILNLMAYSKAKMGQYPEAFTALEKSKFYIKAIGSDKLNLENLLYYARVYELKGDKTRALQFLNEYIEKRDSLQLKDKLINYEQLRIIAETNEKIKDIELLKNLNRIQKEELRNQRTIQIGSIVLLALLLIVLILVIQMLRTKTNTNRMLERLVEERTSELKKAKELAEQSDFQKSEFLSNISHEVRTPMNAIVGFSDLLMHNPSDSNQSEEILSNIKRSTLKLLNLFEKISIMVQLDTGLDVDSKPKECDFVILFKNIETKALDRLAECELKITINYQIDDALLASSFLLPVKSIEMILNELLDNAIKFSGSGKVEYGVFLSEGKLNFYVSDNGIGIEKENIEKVFDKFVKFAPTHCGICDGAGIGLAIVKKNIENFGGSISIISEKGAGTRVEFTVPLS